VGDRQRNMKPNAFGVILCENATMEQVKKRSVAYKDPCC